MKFSKISNNGIKALFDLASALRTAIKNSNADGKINFADLPQFFGVVMALLPAINSVRAVAAELIDLDENEVEEIKERLREFSKDEDLVNLVGYLLLALAAGFDLAKK